MALDHFLKPAVERGCGDAPVPERIGGDGRLHELVQILAAQCRDGDHRQAAQLRQGFTQSELQLSQARLLVFHPIPFVERNDKRTALLLHEIGYLQILLLERRLGIDDQNHHFGKADGAQGIGDRELFKPVVDPGFLAQSGGVPQLDRLSLKGPVGGDGVPRDARFGTGEHAFLSQERVDERRFAGIGPADDGKPQRTVSRSFLPLAWRFTSLSFK